MGHLDELWSVMGSLNAQNAQPVVLEGIVQAGSYDPTNGTVQVTIGHSVAAASFDDGDQPMVVTAALATIGYGDQYGPIGNERALVLRAGTHFIAFIEFGPDDSPNVPSGERWIVHRNPQSGTIDAVFKLENNTPGTTNGVGSVTIGAGQVYTLYDGNGKAISHVAGAGGYVGLGDLASVLSVDPTRAVPAQADLTTLCNGANGIVQQTLVNLMAAIGNAIGASSANWSVAKSALQTAFTVASFVTGISNINPQIPNCSATVFVKS